MREQMCCPLRQLAILHQTLNLGQIIPIYKSFHVPLNSSCTKILSIYPNLYPIFQESIQWRKQGIQVEGGQRQEKRRENGSKINPACIPHYLPHSSCNKNLLSTYSIYGIKGEKMSIPILRNLIKKKPGKRREYCSSGGVYAQVLSSIPSIASKIK